MSTELPMNHFAIQTLRQPLGRRNLASGFSLIEILVGIVIGMVGLLVIFKTVATWDSHTRSTTSGGDAQVTGTLAMFNLERDIKQAGLGFGTALAPVMGCAVKGTDTVKTRALDFPFYPVLITAAADAGAPDRIDVLYGNSAYFGRNGEVTDSTATTKKLKRRAGFRGSDVAVIANPATAPASCDLIQIADATNADNVTVTHASGTIIPDTAYVGASTTSRYNGVSAGSYGFGSSMYNLGTAPVLNRWEITGRALTRTDYLGDNASLEVADGVINMQAQYGVDANNDNIIADTEWVDPSAAAPADWTKVRAIRVAILVRSSQFEKPPAESPTATPVAVTATAPKPSWATGSFLMTNVNGSADSETTAVPNNWRYYRYRVYEKVIPLRNVIWGTAP
jgi:type IV pilus assembly protein PilW